MQELRPITNQVFITAIEPDGVSLPRDHQFDHTDALNDINNSELMNLLANACEFSKHEITEKSKYALKKEFPGRRAFRRAVLKINAENGLYTILGKFFSRVGYVFDVFCTLDENFKHHVDDGSIDYVNAITETGVECGVRWGVGAYVYSVLESAAIAAGIMEASPFLVTSGIVMAAGYSSYHLYATVRDYFKQSEPTDWSKKTYYGSEINDELVAQLIEQHSVLLRDRKPTRQSPIISDGSKLKGTPRGRSSKKFVSTNDTGGTNGSCVITPKKKTKDGGVNVVVNLDLNNDSDRSKPKRSDGITVSEKNRDDEKSKSNLSFFGSLFEIGKNGIAFAPVLGFSYAFEVADIVMFGGLCTLAVGAIGYGGYRLYNYLNSGENSVNKQFTPKPSWYSQPIYLGNTQSFLKGHKRKMANFYYQKARGYAQGKSAHQFFDAFKKGFEADQGYVPDDIFSCLAKMSDEPRVRNSDKNGNPLYKFITSHGKDPAEVKKEVIELIGDEAHFRIGLEHKKFGEEEKAVSSFEKYCELVGQSSEKSNHTVNKQLIVAYDFLSHYFKDNEEERTINIQALGKIDVSGIEEKDLTQRVTGANLELVFQCRKSEDYKGAVRHAKIITEIDQSDLIGLYFLADGLLRLKKYEEAQKHFKKLKRLNNASSNVDKPFQELIDLSLKEAKLKRMMDKKEFDKAYYYAKKLKKQEKSSSLLMNCDHAIASCYIEEIQAPYSTAISILTDYMSRFGTPKQQQLIPMLNAVHSVVPFLGPSLLQLPSAYVNDDFQAFASGVGQMALGKVRDLCSKECEIGSLDAKLSVLHAVLSLTSFAQTYPGVMMYVDGANRAMVVARAYQSYVKGDGLSSYASFGTDLLFDMAEWVDSDGKLPEEPGYYVFRTLTSGFVGSIASLFTPAAPVSALCVMGKLFYDCWTNAEDDKALLAIIKNIEVNYAAQRYWKIKPSIERMKRIIRETSKAFNYEHQDTEAQKYAVVALLFYQAREFFRINDMTKLFDITEFCQSRKLVSYRDIPLHLAVNSMFMRLDAYMMFSDDDLGTARLITHTSDFISDFNFLYNALITEQSLPTEQKTALKDNMNRVAKNARNILAHYASKKVISRCENFEKIFFVAINKLEISLEGQAEDWSQSLATPALLLLSMAYCTLGDANMIMNWLPVINKVLRDGTEILQGQSSKDEPIKLERSTLLLLVQSGRAFFTTQEKSNNDKNSGEAKIKKVSQQPK